METTKKTGNCNPERNGGGGMMHVIPRKRGAERSAEEESKCPHASFGPTKTTNPRVCLHVPAPDGVPGAETVQPTHSVGSG